jgi:hypothetical protein
VSNTVLTEAFTKAVRLTAEGTAHTKNQLSILQGMIRGVVDGAVFSLTKVSLMHLPHCTSIIGETIVRPSLILL